MAIIRTASGLKIYIAAAVTEAQSDTLAEFQAITPWTEIKGVTNAPEYGDESALVTSTDLSDARVRKAKGPRDAGAASLTVNVDPADPGQVALDAAEGTSLTYPFKVVYNDKLTTGGTGTEDYFRAIVRSKRRGGGDATSVLTRVFNIDIDSAIFTVAAT